ncbi:hypothetical protein KY285_007241 [Solanum tuberosum]|nr:hypothetical protein KY284_007365 [Solanum tuberosum]KAH0745584.1 hypothetical protein KY285_007241 [Solanum tuberosum]
MFRSFRVVLADDNNKKTLNDVNRLVTRKCINWFSVPECSMPCTNNLSSCQLGSSNARNGWICEVALRVHKFRSRSWPLIIALTASSEEQVWYLPTGGNGWSNKETCSPT